MAKDWGLRRMLDRAKSLKIWKEPVSVANSDAQKDCGCAYVMTSNGSQPDWKDTDYLGDRGKEKVKTIMTNFFMPINVSMQKIKYLSVLLFIDDGNIFY